MYIVVLVMLKPNESEAANGFPRRHEFGNQIRWRSSQKDEIAQLIELIKILAVKGLLAGRYPGVAEETYGWKCLLN